MTLKDKIKNLVHYDLIAKLKEILLNIEEDLEDFSTNSVQSVTGFGINNTDPNNPIIQAVSSTLTGVVNNTSLQELGGVDKLINGIRIGRGTGTNAKATVLGEGALGAITTGVNNTAIGYLSQSVSTTGFQNTSLGTTTLQKVTSGSSSVAVGWNALNACTTGFENNAVGSNAMKFITTGFGNNGFGQQALSNNIIGNRNSVFGHRVFNASTGDDNIGMGCFAGIGVTSGSRNVIIAVNGSTSPTGITTGNDNLIIAQNIGNTTGITTGSGNTVVGKVTGLAAGLTNTVVISDGVGTIRLHSSSTNLTTLPTQTNALITGDGTGKAILTKEYLASRIGTTAPTSATDTGTTGEIRVAAGFIYWCTAPNTWIRAAGVTW